MIPGIGIKLILPSLIETQRKLIIVLCYPTFLLPFTGLLRVSLSLQFRALDLLLRPILELAVFRYSLSHSSLPSPKIAWALLDRPLVDFLSVGSRVYC